MRQLLFLLLKLCITFKSLDVYYKGFISNVEGRLESHLLERIEFTSRAKDWQLVYVKEYKSKTLAIIE